ncbi:MAG: hypothetical protein Q7J64_04560 [Elusimicrobiota bacterium]|nr:hypothetical protein [Elusimicrobiota bacterium]
MGRKPPVLAAIFSLLLPGLGHLYAGAWGRGMSVLVLSYFFMLVFGVAGGKILLFTYPFLLLSVAYDAWKTTERENSAERAEIAAGPTPRTWLHWVWAGIRAIWITLFAVLFGGAAVASAVGAARAGHVLGAITVTLPGVLLLGLSWLAARSTVRVLRGQEPLTTRAIWNEIGSSLFVVGLCALLLMIVWPSFSAIYRKSAEGEMKGGLASLRDAFARYRLERSENPPSLEALVESKHLAKLPRLWPKNSGIPHAQGSESILLPDSVSTDSGKWAFAVGSSTPIFIDCTHTDTRGLAWTSY